jgi:hypothetical protein
VSATGEPVEESDLHAWVDGRLRPDREKAIETYFAAHPRTRAIRRPAISLPASFSSLTRSATAKFSSRALAAQRLALGAVIVCQSFRLTAVRAL